MSVREHFSLTFIWAFPLYFGRRTSDSSAGETNDDVFLKEMGAQTTFFATLQRRLSMPVSESKCDLIVTINN